MLSHTVVFSHGLFVAVINNRMVVVSFSQTLAS